MYDCRRLMADLRRRPDADRAQGELANSRVQRVEERDRRRTGWAAAVSSWRLSCRLPATPLPRERADGTGARRPETRAQKWRGAQKVLSGRGVGRYRSIWLGRA